MKLAYTFGVIMLLVSYVIFKIVIQFDLTRDVRLRNHENCEKIPLPMPTEDLTVFNNFLIGATFDSIPAFHKHFSASSCKPGFLISINPSTKAVKKIPTHGFPPEFQLNGHGIKLYNDKTLYVISHGYAKGGERIFLFDLEMVNGEVEATYKDNFYFEGDHGLYNGLAVVDEKHFYLTQWAPFADHEAGRNKNLTSELKWMFMSHFTDSCPLKFCSVTGKNQVKCEDKAYGMMPNGLWYVNKMLFLSDSHDKSLKVFNVKQNFDLDLVQKVYIDHVTDNVWWSDGVLYVATIGNVWELLEYGGAVQDDKVPNIVSGGVTKVYQENGVWVSETIIMQNNFSLPTSVVITDKMILSSIHESSLLICPRQT